MANFNEALEYVLENEGGFSNHEKDRGGATKFGISSVLLSAFLQRAATLEDVTNIDKDQAEEIYKKYFWDVLKLDEVKDQMVATAIFDVAVNMGCSQATKLTQSTLNELCEMKAPNGYGPDGVAVDGHLGVATLEGINKVAAPLFIKIFRTKLLAKYSDIVAKIPEQKVFIKGWTARADRLLTLVSV